MGGLKESMRSSVGGLKGSMRSSVGGLKGVVTIPRFLKKWTQDLCSLF